MSAAIDTEGPRFYVSTIEGYAITQGTLGSGSKPVLVATVIDSFYGSEHGRFASNDARGRAGHGHLHSGDPGYGLVCACGGPKVRQARLCLACRSRNTHLGRDGALVAAAARCAELNAWHECEEWGEDVPLAARTG